MTAESAASDARDVQDSNGASGARPAHPLDDETRRREWKKLFDDYQAEHGAFTDEEIAQARKDMYG
ncbi:MAG: hypothetical protein OXC06_01385 [Acidimicrobiaceae bacterium]|nr:hypothetical protein [Acidimicrobiaceae bacterium]